MFKQIPKSNISQRQFKVYKEWITDQTVVPVTTAYNEDGLFDLETSTQSNGLYVHPLYNSIIAKYYSANGNTITQYGVMKNPAEYETERPFSTVLHIIDIAQPMYGEQIKKGSVTLQISGALESFIDNSYGQLITPNPTYEFTNYDNNAQTITFNDGVTTYVVTVSFFDVNSGIAIFTIDGNTDNYYITQINFETGIMTLSQQLVFPATDIQATKKGNVFYSDGLIVVTNYTGSVVDYDLSYRSTQTLYETEVLVSATKGEFNASQNPTAIDITVSNSYEFNTTAIANSKPAGTTIINEIADIRQKSEFFGSVGSSTGSWDDYYNYGTTDPTGSYISTFVTTIGLYDAEQNMVAVAKLPQPIKKLPDYNLNFIIRLDT